jgi:hypothetical protein
MKKDLMDIILDITLGTIMVFILILALAGMYIALRELFFLL